MVQLIGAPSSARDSNESERRAAAAAAATPQYYGWRKFDAGNLWKRWPFQSLSSLLAPSGHVSQLVLSFVSSSAFHSNRPPDAAATA